MIDWQIDVALELGIISEDQVTEDMQNKLEKFEEACITNEQCVRDSYHDHYPRTILESAHKSKVSAIEKDKNKTIHSLERDVTRLGEKIREKDDSIRILRHKLGWD